MRRVGERGGCEEMGKPKAGGRGAIKFRFRFKNSIQSIISASSCSCDALVLNMRSLDLMSTGLRRHNN